MKLTVIGSSSSGNGYIIQDHEEALILEAGVSLSKVKQALGFDVNKVTGVLISHLHGDHSKYARDFENCFPVYSNASVIEAKGLRKTVEIFPEKGFKAGNFKVYPFTAAHDVPTLGFLINHSKIGTLMFLTDSFLCEYRFENLNHIMIESNYIDEILDENVRNGLHYKVKERVMTSHMSLQTTKHVLLNQPLESVYNIVLIHLSENNSDPKQMYEEIAKSTGKPISIAKPGLEIELTKNPY